MPAVVHEGQNANVIGQRSIVNRESKTGDEILPQILLNDVPAIRRFENDGSTISCIEKLGPERGNATLVEPRRFDEFGLGVRVINQSHPMARRAARITCS